jgi:hypothetical protein
MADDLNRFLRHEPIRARRATAAQRVRKWLRRHPAVPVAATVVLILLTVASVISAGLILGERGKTRQALKDERQRAKEADERFRLARRSVDDMIQTAESELADNPMMQGLRKKLLESALAYYQEFINQRSDDPDVQAELAVTRDRVKQILADLAEIEGSGQLFLLNDADVLADLEVKDDQRQQLNDLNRSLAERRGEVFRDFRRLSSEEKRVQFVELARANERGVEAILELNQIARLRQIWLQMKGLSAFREPAVVAVLRLTPDQQQRIKAFEADMFMGPFGPGGPRGGPPPDGPKGGPKKGPDDHFRGPTEKALTILNDDQRQKWKELTGKPFVRRRGGPFRNGRPFEGGFGPPPERKD